MKNIIINIVYTLSILVIIILFLILLTYIFANFKTLSNVIFIISLLISIIIIYDAIDSNRNNE